MIGLITAMNCELEAIRELLENEKGRNLFFTEVLQRNYQR